MEYIVQKSGTVESVNIDVGDIVFGRVVIFPFYINQALLVVVLSAKIHTVSAVNRNTTPFGDVADNFIAWNWVTALSNPNQEARSALDNHATFVTDLQGIFFIFNLDLATFDQLFCFCACLGPLFFSAFILRQAVKDGNSPNLSKTNRRKQGFFCLIA